MSQTIDRTGVDLGHDDLVFVQLPVAGGWSLIAAVGSEELRPRGAGIEEREH